MDFNPVCFGTPANIMHSRLAYIIVCSICDYILARPRLETCLLVCVSVGECGCGWGGECGGVGGWVSEYVCWVGVLVWGCGCDDTDDVR